MICKIFICDICGKYIFLQVDFFLLNIICRNLNFFRCTNKLSNKDKINKIFYVANDIKF